jgi:hypothetical protein
MAEQRGGYRRPSKPAPVSGPNQLSRRTDTGPKKQGARYMRGGAYGEGQEMMGLQQAAPMAAGPKTPRPAAPIQRPRNLSPLVGLTDPTQRPDEPLTAGMPFGAGPGPDALNLPSTAPRKLSTIFGELAQNDRTGETNAFYQYLQQRGL